MRNLLRFIINFRGAFLFILLQLLSFFFLFRSNSYHNAVYFHSAQEWIGELYNWRSTVTEYLELRERNERLQKENEKLRDRLLRYKESPSFRIYQKGDSSSLQRYEVFRAHVINSTLHRRNNHLTIDRGRENGIRSDMGVVGPNGIVGVVRNVSEHFATVLPVLNSNFIASVKLARTNDIGLLEWNGSDPTQAQMVDVAQHVKVRKGDTVVTRGASAIFPEGIPVGSIESVETDPSKNYHRIEVKLSTDFSKLYHVYVIGDRLKEEKEALEEKAFSY